MQRMCSTFSLVQLLLTFVSFVNLEKEERVQLIQIGCIVL